MAHRSRAVHGSSGWMPTLPRGRGSQPRSRQQPWGRSIDLKDASAPLHQATDVVFLVLVQGLPLGILVAAAVGGLGGSHPPAFDAGFLLVALTAALLGVRWMLAVAMAPSYARRGITYWLNPLADPLAVLRIVVSSLRRPRRWRTREY